MLSAGARAPDPHPAAGRWRTFLVLLVAGLLGVLAIIPYSFALTPPQIPPGAPPLAVLVAASLVQNGILLAVAVAIGLWLGPPIGLGAPLLRDLLLGVPGAPKRVRGFLLTAAIAGIVATLVVIALDVLVFAPRLPRDVAAEQAVAVAPWQGFLASFYGGIDEEVFLRFGLMTLLVWIGTRLTRASRPSVAVLWTANVLAAVLFGLGHLPATAALIALTPVVIARAVVLNGLVGLVCGVLYWREGILAAMFAHFCGDLVLHVIAPIVAARA